MSIFRIAIPAYVIFEVKAATEEEALQHAREVQLENDCVWDVPGGIQQDMVFIEAGVTLVYPAEK